VLQVGGRFFYHLHSTAMSDFGLGGSLGIANAPDPAPMSNDSVTLVYVEPALQIRLFLAANVAVSASAGIVIGVADASGVAVTGQTITGGGAVSGLSFSGGAGIHYYFF
jgi:hypothetical protein